MPKATAHMLRLDEIIVQNRHFMSIGILYRKKGQNTRDEIAGNRMSSTPFPLFCSISKPTTNLMIRVDPLILNNRLASVPLSQKTDFPSPWCCLLLLVFF